MRGIRRHNFSFELLGIQIACREAFAPEEGPRIRSRNQAFDIDRCNLGAPSVWSARLWWRTRSIIPLAGMRKAKDFDALWRSCPLTSRSMAAPAMLSCTAGIILDQTQRRNICPDRTVAARAHYNGGAAAIAFPGRGVGGRSGYQAHRPVDQFGADMLVFEPGTDASPATGGHGEAECAASLHSGLAFRDRDDLARSYVAAALADVWASRGCASEQAPQLQSRAIRHSTSPIAMYSRG
ncbi:MAG: hypothetical protein JWO26_2074 [Rhodospirillales bacterium]|nr:hypothetical protein [Rhodospirillales bacterium]